MANLALAAVASTSSNTFEYWILIGLFFVIALIFALSNVVLSAILGPSRKGRVKDSTYESGVDPLGSTKDRFNVRFYLVAMVFLVLDVEILFLIPWVMIFSKRQNPDLHLTHVPLFASILIFSLILILAYVYAWAKDVFNWS